MTNTNYVNKSKSKVKIENQKKRLQIAVTLILIISFLFIFTGLGNANSYGDVETEYIDVLIEAGESIWSIADEYTPNNRDIRLTISLMVEINNIESDVIYPGDFIKVPKIY